MNKPLEVTKPQHIGIWTKHSVTDTKTMITIILTLQHQDHKEHPTVTQLQLDLEADK